jgi:ligand-binding sensor domain-containing protein
MGWSFRESWRAVAVLSFLLIFLAGVVGWRASRALRSATEEVRTEGEIRFIARPLPENQEQDFESISTPAVFVQAARFLGDLYIAGPAGLSQYSASGTLLKHYAVGQELPSSPLVTIARAVLADSQETELVIATELDGLLVFNGRTFRQIIPQDPSARTITSVLPAASGHLLIGTRKRGVLLYDGKKITVLHPTLSNLYVTTLARRKISRRCWRIGMDRRKKRPG